MKPKRVLHYGLLGGIGGVETFVINLYRYVDKERIQFDFLTSHDGRVAFGNEIVSGGGGTYTPLFIQKKNHLFGIINPIRSSIAQLI